MKKIILMTIIFSFWLINEVGAQPRLPGPKFWVAESGSSKVFILGGGEARDVSWLTPDIANAFDQSNEFWLETPPPPVPGSPEMEASGELIRKYGFLDPEHTFYDQLEPHIRESVRSLTTKLGIDQTTLKKMRPWWAYYTINTAFWSQTKRPYNVISAESVLRKRAAEKGIVIRHEYPTFESAIRYFAEMDDTAQSQYIEMLMAYLEDQMSELDATAFTWTTGKPSTKTIDRMHRDTPELYNRVQTSRNRWWADKVEELLLRSGTFFILVGTNHVVGPDGIPILLKRKGVVLRLNE